MAEWTVGQKIKQAREYQRPPMSQTNMAEAIGINRVTLARYETDRQAPPPKVLAKIAALTGLPIDWFSDGQKTPFPPQYQGNAVLSDTAVPTLRDTVQLWSWGEVPCGNWAMPTSDTSRETVSGSVQEIPGDLIVVTIGGHSMFPLLRIGQKVVIKRTSEAQDGQIVLASNENRELTLKILRMVKGNWELHSYNPDYPPVSAKEWTVLGKVVHIEQTNANGIYIS